MKTLGLDISTKSTGWSIVVDGPSVLSYGRIEFSENKSLKFRLMIFNSLLKEILLKNKDIDFVILEDSFCFKNVKTTKTLNKMAGVAIYTIYSVLGDKPIIASIMPLALRSVLVNNFKSNSKLLDKKLIFDYINNRFNLNLDFKKDNDITDSICAALFPFYKEIEKKWIL